MGLFFVGAIVLLTFALSGKMPGRTGSGAPSGAPGEPEPPPGESGSGMTPAEIVAAAKEADAAFAATLGASGTAIVAAAPESAPYVASAGTAVGISWQKLSTRDKARVWTGK